MGLNLSKLNYHKTTKIPQVEKPILANFEPLRLYKKQHSESKSKNLFSELADTISSTVQSVSETIVQAPIVVAKLSQEVVNAVEITTTVVSSPVQTAQTLVELKKMEEARALEQQRLLEEERVATELLNLRKEFEDLKLEYNRVFGARAETLTLPLLLTPLMAREKVSLVRAKIAHEKMLQDLESVYTKGADYFCPNIISKIKYFSFYRIEPDEKMDYKTELKYICERYLKNSSDLEPALKEFNEIIKNFYTHAGACMKEIFDLKKDKFNRIFEHFPVVGIIPKAIRIDEQLRLSKCVLRDYKDVSEIFVENGILSILDKYSKQYEVIKNYVEKSKNRFDYDEDYTKKWLNKIKEAGKMRTDVSSKMLNVYGKNGYNLKSSIEKVENDGTKELTMKAAMSFATMGFC